MCKCKDAYLREDMMKVIHDIYYCGMFAMRVGGGFCFDYTLLQQVCTSQCLALYNDKGSDFDVPLGRNQASFLLNQDATLQS